MTPARYQRLRSALARRQPDLTLLLDQVNKAHNLSAVIRTAEAVGLSHVHAVFVQGNPDLFRSHSRGAEKWLEVVVHDSTTQAIESLRDQGFELVGADFAPDSVDFRQRDYTRPVALIMGAEKYGISQAARRCLDASVHIPMMGLAQALNVSVAAGLLLYEAQRQRWEAGLYEGNRLSPERFETTLFEWAYPLVSAYCREHRLEYPRLDDQGRPVLAIEGKTVKAIRAIMRERERHGKGGPSAERVNRKDPCM